MKPLVILGAGGHAREQLDLIGTLENIKPHYDVLGFLVDREFANPGEEVADLPVLGDLRWLMEGAREVELICAIGSSAGRAAMVRRAEELGGDFTTLVHPSAEVGSRVVLGVGVIIGAGAVLTCDIELGNHVHVNIGCSISHDCVVESFATLAPGSRLAGAARVGRGAELGVGCTVSDRQHVGEWAIAGAGAVIVSDVPPNSTVVGVPARVIEQRKPGWQSKR